MSKDTVEIRWSRLSGAHYLSFEVRKYDDLAPVIYCTPHAPIALLTYPLFLDNSYCTEDSVSALIAAVRDWLQTRYDAGDREFVGLSEFVARAQIEYLQPIDAIGGTP